MAAKTYDPAKVIVSFAGLLIQGYGPDTFISVERDEDGFSKVVGAAGEGARAKNNNRGGSVTLTLLATSLSNDLLSAVAAADEVSGLGVGPLLIKELNGTMLCSAADAWVKKKPKIERGKEVGTYEWVIDCMVLEENAGGLLA